MFGGALMNFHYPPLLGVLNCTKIPSGSRTYMLRISPLALVKESRGPASSTPLEVSSSVSALTFSTPKDRWLAPIWSSRMGFPPGSSPGWLVNVKVGLVPSP